MSKYADWSPTTVFGSTVLNTAGSVSLDEPSRSRAVLSRSKKSPKKRYGPENSQSLGGIAPRNNNDECQEYNAGTTVSHVEREKNLAASLLQRQLQVWLLRRQETRRTQEVQRLRKELHHAAARVIRGSFRRYTQSLAIGKYLSELGHVETQLNALLKRCLARKHQMDEVQHFVAVRQQQKRLEEDQKRNLIRNWLTFHITARHRKQEHRFEQAHDKLLGWVRRLKLRKRVEARVIAREVENQRQQIIKSSAHLIANFYRFSKLRRMAKDELQRRKLFRDASAMLSTTLHLVALRLAQSHWKARTHDLKLAHEAAVKVQRACRAHQAATRFARYRTSSLQLQRVIRGYQSRKVCARLKQQQLQEAKNRQRTEVAITFQRYVRGHLTRVWFGKVVCILRERFRCTNCGIVEPSGTYCKYCGRHRIMSGPLWSVLLLHERWQLDRSAPSLALKTTLGATQATPLRIEELICPSVIVSPPPKKPTLNRSQLACPAASACDIVVGHESLTALPVVLSPRHQRVVAQHGGRFARSKSLANNTAGINSVGEQTARRAVVLTAVQAKNTKLAEAQALELHIARLQRANTVINRSTFRRASIL
ncbi:unnamed protein product [Phytophthora fragariaefolia]|uniref:Unnamed protein product n=1 Tax=Phytophthora fragariaefolia TaxID=1490495 RepID=A0A9W6XGR2_9STRA|nr:unnamed protein product [Phytophthora fragariaefolia]